MFKDKLWYIILVIFLGIFLVKYKKCSEKIENYCPYAYRGEWTYCESDPQTQEEEAKKCKNCAYQRVGLTYFPPSGCCNEICGSETEINKGDEFWCGSLHKCWKKYTGDTNGQKICGLNTLTNQPTAVYTSEEECEQNINPCAPLNRYNCLRRSGCGWCTDSNGFGTCVLGAQDRPTNLIKYNYCYPNRTTGINSYYPGDSSTFFRHNFFDNPQ